uniref:Ribbon-helix-helix domain-containing protein n=1 Tax=candidate division CPR3 bacterium TaxID=2268181 RepID=A0A7C5UVU9_UNCC3
MAEESYLDRLNKEKKKKISVYLSPEIAKRLKYYGAENDITLSQAVEEALKLLFEKSDKTL